MELGLPAPTYVASGTGLHVYWPLVDTLEPRLGGDTPKGSRRSVSSMAWLLDPSAPPTLPRSFGRPERITARENQSWSSAET